MISLQHETTFFGPNLFASNPVLVVNLSFSKDTSQFATLLEQGCLSLRGAFPDWFSAVPSRQEIVEELVAQTVAQWALGALNEVRGFLHDAGGEATSKGARLWVGFHHPRVTFSALELALRFLKQAAESGSFDRHDADAGLRSLWQQCYRHHPDYQARILMEAAYVQDIPVMPFISGTRYWQFGWGSRSRLFLESMSNADGQLGYLFQRSKIVGKVVFASLGFPTPVYLLVNQASELPKAAEKIGWPCVVKPLFSGGGKGVTADIRSMNELEAAFAFARLYTKDNVMVERFVPGDDHRLMVIGGRFFASIRREPSSVTGDGSSPISCLLEAVNRFRTENILKSRYLRPINSDEILERHLEQQGVSIDTVLESGRRITLRSNSNLSTGGICIDVTDRTHPHVRKMAETVAKTMGLATVGIDYMTTDIEKSWMEDGALIEANTTPGLDAMIAAGQDPVMVASAVLGAEPGTVPVWLAVVRHVELELAEKYLKSQNWSGGYGWSCNGLAAIDDMPLCILPSRPWPGVQALLRHKVLNHLFVVCTAEDIVRHGMPVEKVMRLSLCCEEAVLMDEWLQVLIRHSDAQDRYSCWNEFAIQEFTELTH